MVPYAADRALDLVDCVKFEVGYGGVADVEVRATDWVSTGLGAAGSFRWGFDGRQLVGFPRAKHSGVTHHYGFPIVPIRSWLSLEPYEHDGWVRFFYTDLWVRDRRFFSPSQEPRRVAKSIVLFDLTALPRFREPGDRRDPVRAYDLHVGASLLGSLRIGLSPGQLADFVLGWFGGDLAGDDGAGRPQLKPPGGSEPPGGSRQL